jgi:hypothetical protein
MKINAFSYTPIRPVRCRRRAVAADVLHHAAAGKTASARRCRRENIGANVGVLIVMY